MTLAEEFFGERELNHELGLDTEDALWHWVMDQSAAGASLKRWMPLDEAFFRGQASSSYGLSSSLYRVVRRVLGSRVSEADMARAEQAALEIARSEGLGRHMTDGELLMILQHHQAPTRLIDVSEQPVEALFFATETRDADDGRLFIINPHNSGGPARSVPRLGAARPWDGTKQTLDAWRRLPWSDAVRGTQQATQDWTSTLSVVADAALDPRMRAQLGHFLVGGLIARYSGMKMQLRGADIPVADWAEITTVSLNFPKSKTSQPNTHYAGTAWSIRIRSSWKEGIRRRLAALPEPVNEDSMYPPLVETKRLIVDRVKDAASN